MSEPLLSPWATILLGVAALLSLVLHLPNPIKIKLKKYEGMTRYQAEAEFEKALKKDPTIMIIGEIWELLYTVVLFLSTFLIDPGVTIMALTRNIGYQPIAVVMLIMAGITIAIWTRNIVLGVRMSKGHHVDEAETGLLPSRVMALADKIKLSERTRY